MTKPTPCPVPVEILRQHVAYDSETGFITHVRAWGKSPAGRRAELVHPLGYLRVHVCRVTMAAHRIAWALHYGTWPILTLDHINLCKADNRIANLREVTQSENNCNKNLQVNNTSGYKGVTWHKRRRKWQARIKVNNKVRWLGEFRSKEAAAEAYKAAHKEMHGEYAR